MKEYLEQLEHYRAQILSRKAAVEELLRQWDDFGCDCDPEKHPDAPCCILQTEHELLTRYVHILERELWYIKNKD